MSVAPTQSETVALRHVAWWGLLVLLCGVAAGRLVMWPAATDNTAPADSGYRIDVNHDDAATLQLLPGIGPSIAENVVTQRQQHGPFTSPADLEDVRMIGPVLRGRITPWVTFGPPPESATPAESAAETSTD